MFIIRDVRKKDISEVIEIENSSFSSPWVKEAFDSIAKGYADKGLIVARHWELDIRDDTLTPRRERMVPDSEMSVFNRISGGGVPAYSMGCRYIRLGNGHERENNIEAEKAEFMAVIEMLIRESNT